jgi:hypothetical protein
MHGSRGAAEKNGFRKSYAAFFVHLAHFCGKNFRRSFFVSIFFVNAFVWLMDFYRSPNGVDSL